MPANLSPEYIAAEKEYKSAKGQQEKLACLEKMLSTIPKHKGTEKLQADIKKRISRMKESLEKKSGKKGFSMNVEKEGAAQVALVGSPNSGKSTIVEASTNAKTEMADWRLSTRTPVPGMLVYENIKFQLVDLPPVCNEYMEPWVTDIIRGANSCLLTINGENLESAKEVEEVLNILEAKKIIPSPTLEKGESGGAYRRLPTMVIVTKSDLDEHIECFKWAQERFKEFSINQICAMGDDNFTPLAKKIFDLNQIIRIYSKTPGKEADLSNPFTLCQGDTLIDFAKKVHKDFEHTLRYARVWGKNKYDGQRVTKDQPLDDGDIIELRA